jgi:methyl-accepting chemotaxis protein
MYMSFKTKASVVVIGMMLLFWLVVSILVINDMKSQITGAVAEKAKSDSATALEIIDYMHSGEWQVIGGELYKGNTKINGNIEMVDKIGSLTNDTVTIFLGDTRIATNIMRDGKRAVGTKAADYVTDTVLNNGKQFIGEAEVVGEQYKACYSPLKDERGSIIGMFYVGVSKKFADQLQQTFTAVAVLSARITILCALAATCFIPFDAWPTISRRKQYCTGRRQ